MTSLSMRVTPLGHLRVETSTLDPNNDDGVEFFGGTVNTCNLVVAFAADDSFDIDQGHSGTHQFWFAITNSTAGDGRLYAVDPDTQERTAKDSAHWYREAAAAGGLPDRQLRARRDARDGGDLDRDPHGLEEVLARALVVLRPQDDGVARAFPDAEDAGLLLILDGERVVVENVLGDHDAD